MENGEVVNEAPAPSIEDQMLDALSEDEGSQPSDPDGDTIEEPGSDTEEVEAQDEQVEDEWKVEEEEGTNPFSRGWKVEEGRITNPALGFFAF